MSKVTTLSEFIVNSQKDFKYATGELTQLLSAIQLAAKIVNREVNKAGLVEDILGATGTENIQGENQMNLDVYANNQFIESIRAQGIVCGIGSEENEDFIAFDGDNSNCNYVVLMDPLDGSSNIEVNVSIGTIFSIYRRVSKGPQALLEDFLQPGINQIAAGYVIYGSSTMIVLSTGNGVNGFTYDSSIGVFCLSHSQLQSPKVGKIYSVNEGNYFSFPVGVQSYIKKCKKNKFTARYIGSFVSDFHRNLIKGGVYLYPATESKPKGKLRLLYELNPLAFLIEQAGGKATDGTRRILEIVPEKIHQRSPVYIGSANMVDEVCAFLNEEILGE